MIAFDLNGQDHHISVGMNNVQIVEIKRYGREYLYSDINQGVSVAIGKVLGIGLSDFPVYVELNWDFFSGNYRTRYDGNGGDVNVDMEFFKNYLSLSAYPIHLKSNSGFGIWMGGEFSVLFLSKQKGL